MPLSHKISEVATYIKDKIEVSGLADSVYYGDQDRVDGGNTICVEPDTKVNDLTNSSAARGINIEFVIQILVYTAKLQSVVSQRLENDRVAEAVEDLIHADKNFGGMLIHGYITTIASGYSRKTDTIVRTSRIEYHGISQNRLPS